MRRIVAISDFCTQVPPVGGGYPETDTPSGPIAAGSAVRGGYLERLPLAAVCAGLVETAEIWDFAGGRDDFVGLQPSPWGLATRRFRADPHAAPYGSAQLRRHIRRFGAPEILCIWGLGVTAETLDLCADSIIIYNSLDVDALRVPPEISARCDIFLTGSQAQTDEVLARHPNAIVAMLPIGPDFASPRTFYPLDVPKEFDVIYVAAAQAYKRHDILFNALAGLSQRLRTLCVFGYGEDAGALRQQAAELELDMEFTGPPGVPHDQVNRLMNRARVGVVCGVDDGAPAILTEYMLAGLPVLANAQLRCGLHYIRPETGRTASAAEFGPVLSDMLGNLASFAPRETVLANWTWDHSVQRLAALVDMARDGRMQRARA